MFHGVFFPRPPGDFLPSNDLEYLRRIRRLMESTAEIAIVQKLGDVGQGVEVFLESPLWYEEQYQKRDWLAIQGLERNSLA